MVLRAGLRLLLVLTLATACATTTPPSPQAPAESPRVRCLNNPAETEMRPLFFLF